MFHTHAEQFTSNWLSAHLTESYNSYHKKYKKILKIDKPNDKNIEEFIFNMIKAEKAAMAANPTGIGGFSLVFKAKAVLTFISSLDHTVYTNNGK